MTDLLQDALDGLVPSFVDAQPDWADVLLRSRRASRRRVFARFGHGHPRRAVLIALVVLAVVVLATPAFGVQGYVLQLLGRKNVSFGVSPHASNVVKKQFLDMPVGAPTQWSTPVRATQTRIVGTFSIAGHPRKLWVAPTTKGGFCFEFQASFGGCRLTRADRAINKTGQFGVTWQGGSVRQGVSDSIVTRVGGDITAPTAATITVRYADGTEFAVPFVWVSAPISAGFYSYDIPTAHWNKARRLLDVSLYDRAGHLLGRQSFPYRTEPTRTITVPTPPSPSSGKPPRLPTAPAAAPTTPRQTGSADGIRVVIGHNGAVQFTETKPTPALEQLRGHVTSYNCFRLTKEFGIPNVRDLTRVGLFAPHVGITLSGIGSPVDGCELTETGIGHRWPDSRHGHAPAEIPLTANGRTYFANVAAARNLSLFVRSKPVQHLRKEPALQARAAIFQRYKTQLTQNSIEVTIINADTIRFSERGAAGKTFEVVVEHGRIRKQNVSPYAFVF